MTIAALPTPPSRADSPETFAAQADALLGALPAFAAQANALQSAVNANEASASAAAATATAKADIATTRAGEASASAASADAARISAESARNLAAGYSDAADQSAAAATASATAADQSAAAAAIARDWAESVTEVAPGQYSAKHWALEAGSIVTQGLIDDAATSSIRTWSSQKIDAQRIPSLTYDDRASLRALTPAHGQQAIIDGLGLFAFHAGSDEPDDDESCFATAAGRWLLEAVHWDVVDAWQLPDDEARDAWDEDEPLRFASSFASSFAMSAVAASSTAMSAVIASSTAMSAVAASSTAISAVNASVTAMDAIYASPLITKVNYTAAQTWSATNSLRTGITLFVRLTTKAGGAGWGEGSATNEYMVYDGASVSFSERAANPYNHTSLTASPRLPMRRCATSLQIKQFQACEIAYIALTA